MKNTGGQSMKKVLSTFMILIILSTCFCVNALVPDSKPTYMLESFDGLKSSDIGVADAGITSPVSDMTYFGNRNGSVAISANGEDKECLEMTPKWAGKQKGLPIIQFDVCGMYGSGKYVSNKNKIMANWQKAEGLRLWIKNTLTDDISFSFEMFLSGFKNAKGENTTCSLVPYLGTYLVYEDGTKEQPMFIEGDTAFIVPTGFTGWIVIPTSIAGSEEFPQGDESCGMTVNRWYWDLIKNPSDVTIKKMAGFMLDIRTIAEASATDINSKIYIDSLQLFGENVDSNYVGTPMKTEESKVSSTIIGSTSNIASSNSSKTSLTTSVTDKNSSSTNGNETNKNILIPILIIVAIIILGGGAIVIIITRKNKKL